MLNSTQPDSKVSSQQATLTIYGFERKERAVQVALLLLKESFIITDIFTIDREGKLLCCEDANWGQTVFVKVIRWSPDEPLIEWTTDHRMFSRNMRGRARKALIKHTSGRGSLMKKAKYDLPDLPEMNARMARLAS